MKPHFINIYKPVGTRVGSGAGTGADTDYDTKVKICFPRKFLLAKRGKISV
jgi:hypothetical protein